MKYFFLCVLAACSSTPDGIHPLNEMLASPMRIRRPPYRSADPQAELGAPDYKSSPLPTEDFNCKEPKVLFAKKNIEAIRQCITKFEPKVLEDGDRGPNEFTYRLIRDFQPSLKLQNREEAPACLVEHLSEIPVPRELFFLEAAPRHIKELDRVGCYSAGVLVDSDKFLGIRMPVDRVEMKFKFPIENKLEGNDDTVRLLIAWALTPFFTGDPAKGRISAKVVPTSICKKCFNDENFFSGKLLRWKPWPKAE